MPNVKPEVEIPPKVDVNWRELIKAAEQLRKFRDSPFTEQHIAPEIHLNVDKPIAVCFSADWHLGSGATDHTAWKKDIEYLLDTDGLYYAVLGDESDNVLSFKTLSMVMEQVLPVDLQVKTIEGVTMELVAKNKLLFTTWSNHRDEFDERLIGRSMLEHLRQQQGVPHLAGMGVVRLYVGQQMYTILATHKARYNSYIHALHGAKRLYQIVFPGDVVAVAHTHQPGHEEYNHYELARKIGLPFGGTSWLVACSSYKSEDRFSQRYFGFTPLMLETVVFWPNERKMECYSSAKQAIDRIRGRKG